MIISENLKYLKSLINLYLNVQNCLQITKCAIKNPLISFRQLHSLSSITFATQYHKDSIDQNIVALSAELRCLPLLSNLTLDLDCTRLFSKQIEDLSSSFEYLTSLPSVGLCLRNCSILTNEGTQKLLKNLGCLVNLSKLDLDLSGHTGVTDESIETLSASLHSIRGLSVLVLALSDCNKITD